MGTLHDFFTKFTSFMRVLSLHNFAKYGCFISINDKIMNNLLRWGRFQPNFRRPLAAKLWTGPKNVWDLKWLLARTTSITMQNLVEIARRMSAWEDEMWCFLLYFFENNAVSRLPIWCVAELLPQDIASAFAGRFRWYLQRFFSEEKAFQPIEQFSKFSLGGATIGARNPNGRKKWKIWENGCKVCAHHFDHPEVTWKKTSTTALYPMYCRCALV